MQELFSGNQNVYFLWAMADYFPSLLGADPLLNSPDPYPFFTWLVTLVPFKFLGAWTTFIYVVLSSVYTFSLFGIAERISSIYGNPKRLLGFSVLFLFLHSSPIWGTYFNLLCGQDLRWIWDSGIAEQGVLRGYLQPSVFGVFFLLSMYLVLKGNYAKAILSLAPAACVHGNYLLLSGILTVLFLVQSRFEKKTMLTAGALFLLVLPYSVYIFNHFMQIDNELKSAIDAAVLSGFEENIHLNPSNWLNSKFYLQLLTLSIGAVLVSNTRLKFTFWAILFLAISISALSFALDSITLTSLNPWRFSVILMPISTILILVKLTTWTGWQAIRPYFFLAMRLMAVALVYFRVFGVGSSDFILNWQLVQIAILPFLFLVLWLLLKKWGSRIQSMLEIGTLLVLIAVGLVSSFVDEKTKSHKAEFIAISKLKQVEEPNTIYIIPTHWTSFRLNARKSVYADENLVYGPALPALTERIKAVENGQYHSILSNIPDNTKVKLITDRTPNDLQWESYENLESDFTCYVLR